MERKINRAAKFLFYSACAALAGCTGERVLSGGGREQKIDEIILSSGNTSYVARAYHDDGTQFDYWSFGPGDDDLSDVQMTLPGGESYIIRFDRYGNPIMGREGTRVFDAEFDERWSSFPLAKTSRIAEFPDFCGMVHRVAEELCPEVQREGSVLEYIFDVLDAGNPKEMAKKLACDGLLYYDVQGCDDLIGSGFTGVVHVERIEEQQPHFLDASEMQSQIPSPTPVATPAPTPKPPVQTPNPATPPVQIPSPTPPQQSYPAGYATDLVVYLLINSGSVEDALGNNSRTLSLDIPVDIDVHFGRGFDHLYIKGDFFTDGRPVYMSVGPINSSDVYFEGNVTPYISLTGIDGVRRGEGGIDLGTQVSNSLNIQVWPGPQWLYPDAEWRVEYFRVEDRD